MPSTNSEKLGQADFSQTHDASDTSTHLRAEIEELYNQFQAVGIKISRQNFDTIFRSSENSLSTNSDAQKDWRKGLGTPTPVALMGFLICLSQMACDLMGWRGAGGNGAAGMLVLFRVPSKTDYLPNYRGSYYFFGGLLMILGGILEFIMGKTFPFVVFCSFGGFWLTIASTLQPFYNVGAAYAVNPSSTALEQGFATVGFTASYGFFQVFMGLLSLIYFICAFRTNLVNVVLFFTLTIAFCLLAAVNWVLAEAFGGDKSKIHTAHQVQIAAGAFLFVTSLIGWYSFFAIMLVVTDFPIQIPVGDLSGLVASRTERLKARSQSNTV